MESVTEPQVTNVLAPRNLGIDLESLLERPEFYAYLGHCWRGMGGKVYLISALDDRATAAKLRPIWDAHSVYFYDEYLCMDADERALTERDVAAERFKHRVAAEYDLAAFIDLGAIRFPPEAEP